MAEGGYFPDIVIFLTASDSDVSGRLLPPKVEHWKQRRAKKLEKKQKLKEKKQKKRVIQCCNNDTVHVTYDSRIVLYCFCIE